jgi:hypothetical protein
MHGNINIKKEVINVSETYRNIVVTSFWRDSVYSGILAGNLRDRP